MFKYDWSQFDATIGLIFMAGVLIVFNLVGVSGFAWFAAGVSALLAWLTILLVPPQSARADLTGLVVYLLLGGGLTWLAEVVSADARVTLVAIFAITFLAYMTLLKGMHAFMVAWCLLYWFMLAPAFMRETTLGSVVYGHVVGTGIVILLNVLKPLWAGPRVEPAVPAVCAFATLSTARISFGLVIFFLFILIAYPWGVMHSDLGHHIGNEKLIGELVGSVIAIAAIGVLAQLRKSRVA